jgi:hypothetical protein
LREHARVPPHCAARDPPDAPRPGRLLRGLAGGGTIHVHDRDHGPLVNRLIDRDLIVPVAHYQTAVDYAISRQGRALLESFGLIARASQDQSA